MSHDDDFPTSYDRKPICYTPVFQEILNDTNRRFSRDMLSSASDYQDYVRASEAREKQLFPSTESAGARITPTKYYIAELRSSKGRITFKNGFFLDIELSKENGLFFFQNTGFNIFGSGITKEDALKDFSEFFIHDYLSYKKAPADHLTEDARRLLQKYESVISEFHSK